MNGRHAVFAAMLAACSSRDAKIASIEVPRPDQVVGGNVAPKSYDIPAGHAAEIRRLFKGGGAMGYPIAVVSAQGTQTQFVNPQPVFIGENRFVVSLPEQHHAALEQVISGMSKSSPQVSSGSYEMTYWMVFAKDAEETTIEPDLGEIEGTIKQLGALGKRAFKLVDRFGGRVIDGDEALLRSFRTSVKQTLTADASGLQLELELEESGKGKPDQPGPFIRTTLRLKPEQAIVLGDTTLSQPVATENGLLLYVVRARRVD
jgi:hypothetical protein